MQSLKNIVDAYYQLVSKLDNKETEEIEPTFDVNKSKPVENLNELYPDPVKPQNNQSNEENTPRTKKRKYVRKSISKRSKRKKTDDSEDDSILEEKLIDITNSTENLIALRKVSVFKSQF